MDKQKKIVALYTEWVKSTLRDKPMPRCTQGKMSNKDWAMWQKFKNQIEQEENK